MIGKKVPVMCINTGEIYPSITAASRASGADKSSMSKHLNGERETIKGKIYMRIDPDLTVGELERAKKARLEEVKRARTKDLDEILIF